MRVVRKKLQDNKSPVILLQGEPQCRRPKRNVAQNKIRMMKIQRLGAYYDLFFNFSNDTF